MNRSKLTIFFLIIPWVLSIVLKLRFMVVIIASFAIGILLWDLWDKYFAKPPKK